MSAHASGAFEITSWEPEQYEEQDGIILSRVRVRKTFHGEIEGTSTAELLMVSAQEGSAAYVGIERIVAQINGRSGSFILQHNAVAAHGAQEATWTIVPDSGTGALRGLKGAARIDIGPDGGHSITFDYDDLAD